MAKQTINVGLASNDGTGDTLRLSQQKANANFTELYDSKQNTLTLTTTGTSGAATLIGSVLNIPQYSGGGDTNHFLGKYTTLIALETAHPTAISGDYAQVDTGTGSNVVNYNWDDEEGWVAGSSGSGATDTDMLPEGTTNKYFTTARVLATLLTGLSTATGGEVVSTDTILVAFGKIQNFINNLREEKLLGTATENLTATGSINIDLSTFSASWIVLTGNVTATLTGLPVSGQTATKELRIKSTTTQTFGITNTKKQLGSYVADGTDNLVIISVTNYPVQGMKITVQYQNLI